MHVAPDITLLVRVVVLDIVGRFAEQIELEIGHASVEHLTIDIEATKNAAPGFAWVHQHHISARVPQPFGQYQCRQSAAIDQPVAVLCH